MNQIRNILFFFTIISGYIFAADTPQFPEARIARFNIFGQTGSEEELELFSNTKGYFGRLSKFDAKSDGIVVSLTQDTFESIKQRKTPFGLWVNGAIYNILRTNNENNEKQELKIKAKLFCIDNFVNFSSCTLARQGKAYYCLLNSFHNYAAIDIENPELFDQVKDGKFLGIKLDGKESDTDEVGLFVNLCKINNSCNIIDLSAAEKHEIKGLLDQMRTIIQSNWDSFKNGLFVIWVTIIDGVAILKTKLIQRK